MAAIIPLALALAFLVSTVFYLATNKTKQTVLLSRLGLQRRQRDSGASTPPRSFPLEKKASNTDNPNYSDTFPPSRRFTLAEIKDAATRFEKPLSELAKSPEKRTPQALDENILTTTRTVYTPAEFSSDEIKALGDFPDYATLSGVPLPKAYPEFDINTAKPKPYRPFRWAYHQTMSFSKMEVDWWLELESTYAARIAQRQAIYARVGKRVLDCLPGAELACKELMEMALQFLAARYPHYFRLDAAAHRFHNAILSTMSDLRATPPLEVLMNNVPEDFAITLRDPASGHYYLRAGVVCSSLGWDLGTKLGMRLDEIHKPIPDYKEKMRFSMDRYFAKIPTDKPIQRGSWGLEVDTPLYMPAGDPHEAYRAHQDPTLDIDRMHLRVDWQTLRRLPLSGGVVFNFKALFTPVTAFRGEPYVPALLLRVLRDGKRSLMEYKGTWHTEHVVAPALQRWAAEQVAGGVVPEGWEEATLEEYPMCPGWEERWHAEQGF